MASSALTFSTSLTALVWVSPLIAFICRTARHRRIALETLEDVSLSVQLTHGSALLLLPILAAEMSFAPIHHLTVGVLLRGIALAGAGGLGYTIAMQVLAVRKVSKVETSAMFPRQRSVLSNFS